MTLPIVAGYDAGISLHPFNSVYTDANGIADFSNSNITFKHGVPGPVQCAAVV